MAAFPPVATVSRSSSSRGDYGQRWGEGVARCFCIESDLDEEESVRLLPIPECFVCPMSQTPMEDPVMTVDGCVYERSYIEQWVRHRQQHRLPVTSPATNQELPSQRLVSLTALKKAIEAYLAHRPELKGSLTASRSFEEAAQMLQSDLLEKQAAHMSVEDELSLLRDSNDVLSGALQEAERSQARVCREAEEAAQRARVLEEAVQEREGACCDLRARLQQLEERCLAMAAQMQGLESRPEGCQERLSSKGNRQHGHRSVRAKATRSSWPFRFTAAHLCVCASFLMFILSFLTVIFIFADEQTPSAPPSVTVAAPWDMVEFAPAEYSHRADIREPDRRVHPEPVGNSLDLPEQDVAVDLLQHGTPHEQTHAALVLGILAMESSEKQASIVQAGAVDHLVQLLTGGIPEARGQAAVALKTLAVNNTYNKVAIVRAGAIAPLLRLLEEDTPEVQEVAESALLTLADTGLEAARALTNLAADDAGDLEAIAQAGWLSVFADLLKEEGLREEALAALRNLATGHLEDELAVKQLLAMKAAAGGAAPSAAASRRS